MLESPLCLLIERKTMTRGGRWFTVAAVLLVLLHPSAADVAESGRKCLRWKCGHIRPNICMTRIFPWPRTCVLCVADGVLDPCRRDTCVGVLLVLVLRLPTATGIV